MKIRRPSASRLGIAAHCSALAWLTWGERTSDPRGPAARGSRLHRALELAYAGAPNMDALAKVWPEEQSAAARAIEYKPVVHRAAEESWARTEIQAWYDPITDEGVVGLPGEGEDMAPPPPGVWRGIVDIAGRSHDGLPLIIDHKTGNPRYQTPPERSEQLAYFAVWLGGLPEMAAEVAERGVLVGVYLTQSLELVSHHLEPDAILAHRAAFLQQEDTYSTLEALDGPDAPDLARKLAPPVRGDWCMWCPAKPNCPEWRKP